MELWIRSQDKEILIKVNNLSLICSNKDETCEIINSFEDHQCWELGIYKTKERALEVLDDIQNFMTIEIHEDNITYEQGDLILKEKIVNNLCKIYRMPQE